ncbi:molecular chaperone DnaK [Arthrobacter sp. B2I5]|nr:Hsp70 family protein [Arthrobacter sp. B2I5]MDQ0824391.1 molecular chaperone DnaK [Arthrobacter sp. B2I5]
MKHQLSEVPMSYALAVDVGTSFTAAAVVRFHHGPSAVPECLPLGARGASVPSVVYYPEEGAVLVGEAAERRGLDSPERVVREFKRRIGDDVPFVLGTLALQPEDVFATMARWVADRAAEREGGPASAVFLTHPAAWGSHRLSVIRDALAAHGLENVTLLPEPEAAALHYASQVRVEEGSTIAVYDLGGGTFDTAVLRKCGSSRFELLGRPEGIEDLGGADFDAAVFRYVAAHTGNALEGLDTSDPAVLGALTRLRRECVEAKEALSADSEASIPVLLPGVQQQVRMVRSEFEALIEEPVRETVEALEHSLAQLHLEPADLSTVLLIGGSSRIPLVAQVVSEELDRPIAVDADPKSSICLGAAVAAVLAHAAAEAVGSQAAVTEADAAEVPSAVVLSDMPPAPTGPAMPSWSRKYTTAAGAPAGPGTVRGARHGAGGAHAPKPTVRVTAVAAAAALLTVLTATAAQSPDGFGSLTAMFVPQAGASTTGGSVGEDAAGAAEAGAGEATTAAGVPGPFAGVEASARKPLAAEPGLEAAAAPPAGQAAGGEGPGPGSSAIADGPVVAGGVAAPDPLAGSGGTPDGSETVPGAVTVDPASPSDTSSGTPSDTSSGTPSGTASGTPSGTPSNTQEPGGSGEPTQSSGTETPTGPGTGEPSTSPATDPPTGETTPPTSPDSTSPASDPNPSTTLTEVAVEATSLPQETPLEPASPSVEAAVETAPTTSPGA